MSRPRIVALTALLAATALAGCNGKADRPHAGTSPKGPPAADEVAAERANLAPEDRALVDAQEWCVISDEERLGSMGPPLKLDIKGVPVFICCKGCKRKAEADPDKTLAKAEGLKAKAKAEKAGKNDPA